MCFKLFLSIFCHLPPFSVKLPKNGVHSLVAKSAENGILIAKNIHFFSTSRFFVIISIRIARIFIHGPSSLMLCLLTAPINISMMWA